MRAIERIGLLLGCGLFLVMASSVESLRMLGIAGAIVTGLPLLIGFVFDWVQGSN